MKLNGPRKRRVWPFLAPMLAAAICLTESASGQLERGRHRFDPWSGLAMDAQHTALSSTRSQALGRVHWQTPVDLEPQYVDNELLIHYGAPLITAENTVIVPVKTGATGGFLVEAHNGTNGSLLWSLTSDYVLPPHNWTPEFGPVLTAKSRLYYPGGGGTVYFRDSPDSATGAQGQLAFYGLAAYSANPQTYISNVTINTPLTADAYGNIYFGFIVAASLPGQLQSGIAKIDANGVGAWTPVTTGAADASMTHVVYNCAPALSFDSGTVYVAISNGRSGAGGAGYLVGLNSATLAPVSRVRLKDPATGLDALLPDDGSAAPTVGLDGDVYFGVLESSNENHERGWLLHFDKTLAQTKTPGAFGWDDTASIVPAPIVPSYTGTSTYLLMTKYNNYIEAGGNGLNRIAVLDPNNTETDPVTGVKVMNEVLTIAGLTADGPAPAVKEWCINSAAVDRFTGSILAGSEDGKLYRWNLAGNTFSQTFVLTSGLGEAYTPTMIGGDGTVYAINNAILFAVGQ